MIKTYKITAFCFFLCWVIFYFTHTHGFQIFERFAAWMEELDRYQVDEIVVIGAILFAAVFIDGIRYIYQQRHRDEIQQQRLRVLKATMTSVQDIMNNFLNSLLLIRLRAEKNNELSQESAKLMNELIRDASEKLKVLGDLEDTPEKIVATGLVGIDYEHKPIQ